MTDNEMQASDGDRRRLGGEGYAHLVTATKGLVEAVCTADAPEDVLSCSVARIESTTAALQVHASDNDGPAGYRWDLPGRGHPLLLPIFIDKEGTHEARGRVIFSSAHMGHGGVVHGGFLPLLFDEVLGIFPSRLDPPARTAYLHVDYRRVTPIQVELEVEARLVSAEGRKVHVEGWLRHDGELVAEASALFVQPRPGAAGASLARPKSSGRADVPNGR